MAYFSIWLPYSSFRHISLPMITMKGVYRITSLNNYQAMVKHFQGNTKLLCLTLSIVAKYAIIIKIYAYKYPMEVYIMQLITEESVQLYINKCKAYIDFMLSQQQWSGLTKSEIEQWLSNFRQLDIHEKYFAYKLLANLIYYSEKDVIDALNEGIHSRLFNYKVLEKQISAKFGLSQQTIQNIVKEELYNARFIPLLDKNAPHESGNYVSRLLVQQGMINASQSMFLDGIGDEFQKNTFKNLIIVDDCVGSGDQLREFWKSAKVSINSVSYSLEQFCTENDIEAYYLTLFGYDKSIFSLKKEIKNLKICCVRTLSDSQRVFSQNSYVWANEVEREKAVELFCALALENGLYLYGYKNLDFAFIMHQTIPDWTLPLFWQETPEWKLLMRRKNSNA